MKYQREQGKMTLINPCKDREQGERERRKSKEGKQKERASDAWGCRSRTKGKEQGESKVREQG